MTVCAWALTIILSQRNCWRDYDKNGRRSLGCTFAAVTSCSGVRVCSQWKGNAVGFLDLIWTKSFPWRRLDERRVYSFPPTYCRRERVCVCVCFRGWVKTEGEEEECCGFHGLQLFLCNTITNVCYSCAHTHTHTCMRTHTAVELWNRSTMTPSWHMHRAGFSSTKPNSES